MRSQQIIKSPIEIDEALSTFRVPLDVIVRPAFSAFTSRLQVTNLSPRTAKGQYSYMSGVKALREAFLPYGWLPYDNNGIEGVRCPNTGLVVLWQNVDTACDIIHTPQNISPKRSGSEKLMFSKQMPLFENLHDDMLSRKLEDFPLNRQVWYYCFSAHGDLVSAELSLPLGIKNGRFNGFFKRIFLIQLGDLFESRFEDINPPIDIQPEIKRK